MAAMYIMWVRLVEVSTSLGQPLGRPKTYKRMLASLFELCLASVCAHWPIIDLKDARVSPQLFEHVVARMKADGNLSDNRLGQVISAGFLTALHLARAPVAVTARLFLHILAPQSLCNIVELDLSDCGHIDTNAVCIHALPPCCHHSLRKLWLANTRTDDAAIKAVVQRCGSLESLNLSGTDIVGSCLATLGLSCSALSRLDLHGRSGVAVPARSPEAHTS